MCANYAASKYSGADDSKRVPEAMALVEHRGIRAPHETVKIDSSPIAWAGKILWFPGVG